MKTTLKSLSLLLILATAAPAQLPSALPTLTGAVFDLTVDQIVVRDVTEPTVKLMTGAELRIGLGLAPTSDPIFDALSVTSIAGAGTGLTGTASGLTAGNSTLSGGQAVGPTASPTFAAVKVAKATLEAGISGYTSLSFSTAYPPTGNQAAVSGDGDTLVFGAPSGLYFRGNGSSNHMVLSSSGNLSLTGTLSVTGASTLSTLTLSPAASATPASNGQLTFEATSNTSLTVKYKGSDGTVRGVVLTLAP